jgi:hypothetical protein
LAGDPVIDKALMQQFLFTGGPMRDPARRGLQTQRCKDASVSGELGDFVFYSELLALQLVDFCFVGPRSGLFLFDQIF